MPYKFSYHNYSMKYLPKYNIKIYLKKKQETRFYF